MDYGEGDGSLIPLDSEFEGGLGLVDLLIQGWPSKSVLELFSCDPGWEGEMPLPVICMIC